MAGRGSKKLPRRLFSLGQPRTSLDSCSIPVTINLRVLPTISVAVDEGTGYSSR